MKQDSFKNFLENQQEIRTQVYKILKNKPRSIVDVAKEMGIGHTTLWRFLKDEEDVDFVRLVKIEKWIDKNA